MARIPWPVMLWNSSTFSSFIFLALASSTMACPSGCSETCSQDAAIFKSSSWDIFSARTSITLGRPSVTVPVLSKTTVSALWLISRASPLFIRMPWLAPSPVPTIIAVGVASPNAQGHAITNTDTKIVSTNVNSYPRSIHTMEAITAIAITAGTKYPATTSANLDIGAFFPCASSIRRTIFARVVSAPTLVTCTVTAP